MRRYYYIMTMGCQMNEYDSDYVGRLLMKSGFRPADDPKAADLVLLNTCTVRAKAQQKAYSLLGRMFALKKQRPGLILGLMGCMAQQEGSDLFKRFPYLDLVVGTREIGRISQLIEHIERSHEKVVADNLSILPYKLENNGYFRGRVKSHISIMEGCNNYCSYCIVPYVRGREISRSSRDILGEARDLISQGIKEITLLGQNVNSYRSSDKEDVHFPLLLQRMNDLKGLVRLRFTTSHPKDLTEELIDCFRDLDKLCPHIHLPFQAGSDRILKRMNRGYSRETYMERVGQLREARPDLSITSDVMVGFPGESDDDFQMTLDLIRKIGFDSLFSFKYSDRKGTTAEKMDNKVEEAEKEKRLKILQDIQRKITLKKNRKRIGDMVEVLVEGESKKGGQLSGRNRNNIIVNFNLKNNIIGNLVNVIIEDAFVHSLRGRYVKEVNQYPSRAKRAQRNALESRTWRNR